MNIEQLSCPQCKEPFTQANPPRLLTMCGHTFCHKCIKTLITKKKDKGFKIKCPIDKGSMEMQKPNPSMFPKNIALIDLMNKSNGEFTSNQFLDFSMVQKNLSSSEKETFQSEGIIEKLIPYEQKAQDSDKKVCKEHNKIMDVYCVDDCQVICTDCALFSHHRSHDVKNLTEMVNLESEKMEELLTIMKEKKEAEEKFMNKEIENEIFDLLDKKRKLIEGQIGHFFAEVRRMINVKQNEIKEDLEAKGLITAERMRDKMGVEKQGIEQYRDWQEGVIRTIDEQRQNSAEGISQRLQKMIKNDYYQSKIKQGKGIIQKMSKKQQQFISQFEETLNSFTFCSHLSEIQHPITNIRVSCQIESNKNHIDSERSLKHSRTSSHVRFDNHTPFVHNSNIISEKLIASNTKFSNHPQLNKTKEKQNFFGQDDEQESLLDFDMNFDSKTLKPSTFSCNNISVLSVNSRANDIKDKKNFTFKPKKRQELPKKLDSSQFLSKSRVSVSSYTPSSRSISKVQRPQTIKPKKTESRFKYQALVENISGDKVDTVDLTGMQPKADELVMILEAVQSSESVKTVKLMRNKLEDGFIEKCMKYLLSVERVNLAQNKFSQQGVDVALSVLKENPGHKIKSLNMGQNRIVERKNRKVLQEFKKLNVNIVL